MVFSSKIKFSLVSAVLLCGGTASANEHQNTVPRLVGPLSTTTTTLLEPTPQKQVQDTQSLYAVFTPKTQTSNATLDYAVWDNILKQSVLSMGPSLRVRAPERKASVALNTRIIKGHKSPYRLEGSRVTFSYMSKKSIEIIGEYSKDLVAIANERDLQSFGKKEQLAFWMNLHNVLLIENIAENYPVKKPSLLEIGPNGESLNEAKLVVIRGVPLSLRDIRENIVYRYWENPIVMYGFFRGDIGGPSIRNYAITSKNVNYVLNLQAFEFVTSLRGFNTVFSKRSVSKIYEEARPYYFRNWPFDLEAHLRRFADENTLRDLGKDMPFQVEKYDYIVADLWGGNLSKGSGAGYSVDRNGKIRGFGNSPLVYERAEKIHTLRRKGMLKRTYTVTITDIDTSDTGISSEIPTNKLAPPPPASK